MANNRIHSYLDYLYEADYRERPVPMKEFLNNPQFLGNVTNRGKAVRKVWRTVLDDVSREDGKYIVVFTGAIGTGKSTSAIEGLAYVMYRVLCLKDPWAFFNRMSPGKMAIVFFNLTRSLGDSRGFEMLQSYLLSSPWFREHGRIGGSKAKPRLDFQIFDYKLASPQSQGFGFIGENIIAAIMDEVDSPIASEPQKRRILKAYEATVRRFITRFVYDGHSLGRLFLVASKQEQLSFLNTFIIKMQNSKEVYVVDIPFWEANDQGDYCGETFKVSLGDHFFPPGILKSEDDIKEVVDKGFRVLDVPIEYKDDFERDIVGSLRDIAGVSITQLRTTKLFASESVLTACYDKSKQDPVRTSTVEIGLNDEVNLANFIDFQRVRVSRNVPRCVHVDIAFTGDALGIGMSCVSGWMKVNSMKPDGTFSIVKKPVVETDLAIRLKARHGDQIPIHKVHQLILDLKNVYRFNIVNCTFDLRIASITSMQTLTLAGIKCDSLSLDKSPQMYRGFKDVVNEGRWVCHFDPYLHFELSNLEDDPVKNKIDHPDEVSEVIMSDEGETRNVVLKGSKDKSDGVVGSVMNAFNICNVPPDQEVMKKLFDSLTGEQSEKQGVISGLTGVDVLNEIDVKRGKNKEDKQSNESNTYLDILKRCNG